MKKIFTLFIRTTPLLLCGETMYFNCEHYTKDANTLCGKMQNCDVKPGDTHVDRYDLKSYN
jgi:hypothetical protein